MYRLEFELAGLPSTPNGAHGAWQVAYKKRKEWRGRVKLRVIMQRPPAPLQKSRVTMTRCSSRQPDYGNLVASFKSVLDGLKDGGIIFDDAPKYVEDVYKWEKAKPKESKIRVLVEELSAQGKAYGGNEKIIQSVRQSFLTGAAWCWS